MKNLVVAANLVAKSNLKRDLPGILQKYWDTGDGAEEIKVMSESLKDMTAWEIMNLVRQNPGLGEHDMSKFPLFQQEIKRAMKQLRVE